tara:strand:+ start:96 stop:869 length:774 start_codon:yes stop_codon:yes gene_type:complete
MSQIPDDEIGLFEFFEALWEGKYIIGVFVIISIFLSSLLMTFKDPIYESKLVYQVDTLPPFYTDDVAMRDFRKLFYARAAFDIWKKDNKQSLLKFTDFSESQNINGVMVWKHYDNRTAIIDKEVDSEEFILIRTNQLELLDDFYNYVSFVNKTLTTEYISRSKEEIKILNNRFADFSGSTDMMTNLLDIDRYIVEAKNGADVLMLTRPSYPRTVFPQVTLIVAIAIILGFFIGMTYIFVRDANMMRKRRLSSTGDDV